MQREVILKNMKKIYKTNAQEFHDALIRCTRIADDTRFEGLLILDEMQEKLREEDFTGRDYLRRGMEGVLNGTEPEVLRKWLENGIDVMDDEKEQLVCLLYMEGLLLMQAGENPWQIQTTLASMFPAEVFDELMRMMQEYVEKRRELRRKKEGINLLYLHYDTDNISDLENALLHLSDEIFADICKKVKEKDYLSLLLICHVPLHEKLLTVMDENYRPKLEIASDYAAYIRKQQIKSAIENWKTFLSVESL